MIFSLGLSAGELAVYSYLLCCEGRKSFTCYPSYSTIGKAVRLSKNTVRKHVMSLEDKGFIRTEHTTITTRTGQKHNGNLKFTLLPIQNALQIYNETQPQLSIL